MTTFLIITGVLFLLYFISKNKKGGLEIQKAEFTKEILADFKLCISKFQSNYQPKIYQKAQLNSNADAINLRQALMEMDKRGELKEIIEQGIAFINNDILNLSKKIFDLNLISCKMKKSELINDGFPIDTLVSLIASDIWLEFYNTKILSYNDAQICKLTLTLLKNNLTEIKNILE